MEFWKNALTQLFAVDQFIISKILLRLFDELALQLTLNELSTIKRLYLPDVFADLFYGLFKPLI